MEQIFTMRQLIEKTREFQQKAYVAFVDFKAAFDSVDRQSLWLILKTTGLQEKYCNLFERLHEGTESCVQVNGRRSSSFEIHTGVRQGCAAAPELFNCVNDYIMTRTISRLQFGLHYGDRVLSDADYADDLALVCDSPSKLTVALQILADEALKIGLSTNWQKTKVMYGEPRNSPRPPAVLMVGDKPAEIVVELTYLGSILSNDGSILKDLMHRIAKASAVVGRLSALWRKLSISRRTKLCIYNASVGSVLLYGAETWPVTQSVLSTVNIAQTKHLRHVEGLLWHNFVSNEDLLALTAQTPFSVQLAQRTLRWYGHLLRMPPDTPHEQFLTLIPCCTAANAQEVVPLPDGKTRQVPS